ncbi:MAG: hypothetical protein K6C08_00715 [Oscillospiraceae bacterium]|nr:hypothetical protein [Oscillospiraceae bacterium]
MRRSGQKCGGLLPALILCALLAAAAAVIAGRASLPTQTPGSAGADASAAGSPSVQTEGGKTAGAAEAGDDASAVGSFPVPEDAASGAAPAGEAVQRPLRELSVSEDNLDPSLFETAREQGHVELVQYASRDRVSGGEMTVMKDLAVYLPYGYDERRQYNVLILLHCAWADHRFWLVEERDYATADGSIAVSVPNMLDRMIEEGWCEPLIVVSPCIYLYDHQPSVAGNQYDYLQFTREFGQDLLPFLAENYATFASDGSREALSAAREHFGLLGASFGAYAEYISVIGDSFDLAAWYAFCGGGTLDPGWLTACWEQNGTRDLPLRMLYIAEGEFDDRYAPESSYFNLLYYGENCGGPFGPENVRYTLIRGWGHEDHSYLVGLFNTLQLFFRS